MKTILPALATIFIFATIDAQTVASKKPTRRNMIVQINRTDEPLELIKKAKRIIQVCEKMNNLKATGEQQKLDSILTLTETDFKGMELTDKDVFYYNEEGQNTIYDYYTNNASGEMEYSTRETYAYANGLIDEIIGYNADINEEDGLMESSKVKLSYTNGGAISMAIMSEWNDMGKTWDDVSRTDFVYNSFDMVSTTVNSYLDGDEEFNFGKTEWYYNQDNQLTKMEDYVDSELDGNMVISYMTEFTYENGLMKSETNSELNDDNQMQYSERYTYSYNDDGEIISELDEVYDTESDEWIIDEKSEASIKPDLQFQNTIFPVFFFDPYPSIDYPIGVYDEMNSYYFDEEWYLYGTANYYYSLLGSSVNDRLTNQTWSVYPNPANDLLYVNSDEVTNAHCVLFDASGRAILDQKVIAGQPIDLSSVKAGYYLLQISNGNNKQTLKIIKQ
jgi:hypothetical protein